MKTAVVIRHLAFEGLGLYNRVLELAGYDVIYFDAGISHIQTKLAFEADILFVMGGPISINDIVKFPYLIDELQLVEDRLAKGMPVFGVGLGAQIMAKALGASIFPMPEREFGWAPLQLLDDEGLLKSFVGKSVLHWHKNAFSLPGGAKLLASTSTCEVQAFSWGKSVALQFHAELDMRKFEQWILGHANEVMACGTGCLNHLRDGSANHGNALVQYSSQFIKQYLKSIE